MAGFTFDTGALLALERRQQRIGLFWNYATARQLPITVPAVVVAEWWRARSDRRMEILAGVAVEPTDASLARLASEAMTALPHATTIDAIVMASAARRGDVVLTSDVEDLTRLQRFFPVVTVLHT